MVVVVVAAAVVVDVVVVSGVASKLSFQRLSRRSFGKFSKQAVVACVNSKLFFNVYGKFKFWKQVQV